jgi:hypothetical protein
MKAQTTALDILKKNIDKLHILALALLEHEILDGEEIDLVLNGKTLPKPEEKKARVKKERARTETRESHKVPGGESGRLRQLEEVVSRLDKEETGSTGRSEGRKKQTDSQKTTSGASTGSSSARKPTRPRHSGGGGSRGSSTGGRSGGSGGKG